METKLHYDSHGVMPEDKSINVCIDFKSKLIPLAVWYTMDGSFCSRTFATKGEADADATANGFKYREPGTYGTSVFVRSLGRLVHKYGKNKPKL